MIIDRTYFVGTLDIAQSEDSNSGVPERLDNYIARYEPEFLERALGYTLAHQFIGGLALDPIPQKWIDLRDGKTYVDGSINQQWKGFTKTYGTMKVSPIANYIYYHYLKDLAQPAGQIGIIQPTAENAVKVAPIQKMVTAWNEMCKWILPSLYSYLNFYTTDYPDFSRDYIFRPQNTFNL